MTRNTAPAAVPAAAGTGRIQQRRVKGWRKPPGVVCVGRGTRWGNPWSVDDEDAPDGVTRAEVVARFRDWLSYAIPGQQDVYRSGRRLYDRRWMVEQLAAGVLRGKRLACWCPEDGQPCHADVLMQLANPKPAQGTSAPGCTLDPAAGPGGDGDA